jgi:lipopolysaccharide exporter
VGLVTHPMKGVASSSEGQDLPEGEGEATMVEARGRLTSTVTRGLGWTASALVMTAVLQVVYTAVMSRLLHPVDFGVVAAAVLSLRFVTYLSRFGLGSAIVQRATLSRQETAVAQSVALVTGSFIAIVAVLASPLLATIVRQPGAAHVIRWMSISILIGAVTSVPEALLRRAMRFRAVAISQVVSFVVGYLGVGISLAGRGWGADSLVAATLTQACVYFVLVVILARPPLRFTAQWSTSRSLLSFGGAVTVIGFMEFLQSSLDTLSVSRWIGTAGLGQYSRATYLAGLPVDQGVTAAMRVLLPTFSSVQDDPGRFTRGYVMSAGPLTVLVIVPVTMVAVAATAVVNIVLGSKWGPAAAVLPIVGAAYGVNLLTLLPTAAIEALGHVRRKLFLQAASLACTATFMATVVAWGPSLQRVAFAWLSGEIVRHILFFVFALPVLGVDRMEVVRRYRAATLLAIAGAVPLFVVVRISGRITLLPLVGACLVSAVLVLGAVILPACRVLRDDLRQIRSNLQLGSVEKR